MSGDVAGRSPIEYVLFGVIDFICLLLAAESLNALQYKRAGEWAIAGVASVLLGYYWPKIREKCGIAAPRVVLPERGLPERPPCVLPTRYAKNENRFSSFGLFLRNPGYDATSVHIPSVSIGQSAYKLTFPETLSVLCERDHIVFMEAWLEDHATGLPGLDGGRLHDVMVQADVEQIKFPILYGGLDFPEYYTICVIERVNWEHQGLTVKEAGHGKGKPAL
jgi:hypothetical protein